MGAGRLVSSLGTPLLECLAAVPVLQDHSPALMALLNEKLEVQLHVNVQPAMLLPALALIYALYMRYALIQMPHGLRAFYVAEVAIMRLLSRCEKCCQC